MKEEFSVTLRLSWTFYHILVRCSPEIYAAALAKVKAYTCGNILETKVAGPIIASLVESLSRVNQKKSFAAFLPSALSVIKGRLGADSQLTNQHDVDDEIKFNLLVLSYALKVPNIRMCHLEPYIADIKEVIGKMLYATNSHVARLARMVMSSLLWGLQGVEVTEEGHFHDGKDMDLKVCYLKRCS